MFLHACRSTFLEQRRRRLCFPRSTAMPVACVVPRGCGRPLKVGGPTPAASSVLCSTDVRGGSLPRHRLYTASAQTALSAPEHIEHRSTRLDIPVRDRLST